jgi:hypothetical protein
MEVATSAADVAVTEPDWRAPLLAYLLDEVLPPDRTEARRIARCAKTFVAIDDKLYKWSLLLEIHAGICGHHAAPWSLVSKAFCQGFYWPTALHGAKEVVRT